MYSLRDVPSKKLGFCPVSGIQIREIVEQYPNGHPLEGVPTKLGRTFPHAVKVVLLMMSGRTTDISMDANSAKVLTLGMPGGLSRLHKMNVKALLEEEGRYFFRNMRQRPAAEAVKIAEAIRLYADDPPVGVLDVIDASQDAMAEG